MLQDTLKKRARDYILTKRQALTKQQINDYSQNYLTQFIYFFTEYQKHYKPKIIGGSYPIHNELDVLPILNYCREQGLKTALPYCSGQKTPLTFYNFNGDITSLKPDHYQIPAPDNNQEIIVPDLIICPAVGVSTNEPYQRLGYGGGFFDTYAQHYPHIHFIGGFCRFQFLGNTQIFHNKDLIFKKIFKIN